MYLWQANKQASPQKKKKIGKNKEVQHFASGST
jgi:hypothetical protein